ncbi:TPA: DNA ligase [Vibrio vulnificus]|uniref:zinc ribbon domain-containing protein n=1 Tax=Vibrio vulnificus TaxID=672 RepID=UPI0009B5D638|nr:zinc ribbon domain-containing protein [Vibrio vulnificus]EGQ8027825.1 DNA ligase [Vibrio vulnificus]EHD2252604.1 DNA ligase [Vibrio vulnificus]EHH0848250.1 DNA ligase [Vibrio vulnificus]EHH2474276.1 DNA ligase [Vibrio vulnificus]EHK8999610.1 zinc ribbon domain-containing protein [Vibrio vulnificus]
MNENHCPICQQELEWSGQYHCQQCDKAFTKLGFCPECEAELEKLQACGAASYFCNHCNELKSKSRIRFQFKEKTED